MADDRLTSQAKVAEATHGVVALTSSVERLGSAKSGAHNQLEKGDDVGAAIKAFTDSVGPSVKWKHELEHDSQAHTVGQHANHDGGSRLGKGLLSPPTKNHQELDLDPNNLGSQLSLLNLISSQEQFDDLSKIGTAFTASTKLDSGWIIDSGAMDHMTYDEFLFHHLIVPPKENVITANGEIAPVIGSTTYFTRLLILKLLNKMVCSTDETETEDLGVISNSPGRALPEGCNTISQSLMDLNRETPDREITHAASNSKPTPFMDSVEANLDWHLKQFDVNTFLHGDLGEELSTDSNNHLAWFGRFTKAMKKYVSVLSQFMHVPSEDHMAAMMRILSYLKGVPSRGLIFRKHGHMEVKRSKKQNVVARSTTKAEYRGMAHGICELLWLRILLTKIGFKPQGAMLLYCDNQAAREITNNHVQHDRAKHVEVHRHFIKEKLDVKLIDIPYVRSEEQLTDELTHAVLARVFQDSLDKLGLGDIYAPT
ncbi:polyprotein (retrotrasposon protein) [Pyrus ussuriensis x Pyrus communis]|uniref:Polyprotein (Retrotrasposon protein) n=1 Tax=Pyrus ussuriensis x Pyrus communis TaxID=2448454 RepID=A0A5N5GBZ5_9ROSA|nr:polyprotein (retrotrasposon protein) [Pyrus ussuriensis x Pyrus communis]